MANFGIDFGQTLSDYLTSHYRSVGPLVPGSDIGWETKFTLWEKTSDALQHSRSSKGNVDG